MSDGISPDHEASAEHALFRGTIDAINEASSFSAATDQVLELLRENLRCDAAGIRMRFGDDYPYYCANGFPQQFLARENSLLHRECDGELSRDCAGKPVLKCLCGMVLRGEPLGRDLPLTAAGSLWTNNLSQLLSAGEQLPPGATPANACPRNGYQSIALIPLTCRDERLGLLQICYQRTEALNPERIALLEKLALLLGGSYWRLHEFQCLREDQNKYRELVEGLDDLVFHVDLSGRITDISPTVHTLLGYTAQELTGTLFCDCFASDSRPEELWESILKGTRQKNEIEIRHKDGHPVWVQISNLPVFEGGRVTGIRGIIVDINQRKIAEKEYLCLFREMLNGFALHELICDEQGKPTDYRFLAVNPAFERMTGMREKEVVGRTVLEIFPTTEPFWIETYANVVLTGTPADFRHYSQAVRKHFHITAFPHGKNQFACMFNDISEEINREKELRASEALHRSFLQTVPIPVFCKDTQGRYTQVNQAMEDFFHRPETFFLGKNAFDIAPPELAQVYADADQTLLESRQLQIYESSIVDYAGGMHDVIFHKAVLLDDAGNASGIIGAIMDITVRKRIARALSESEERMKLALEGADLGMWDWNIVTGEISINRRWAEMLGYDVGEIKPDISSWESLVHSDDLPRVRQILERHLIGETASYEAEMRMRHKNGSWVWIIDKGRITTRDAAGRPLRACGTHLDITEKKNLELEANLRREQLMHADKLATIGTLVACVMHEINNPVGVISLNAPALRQICEQMAPLLEEAVRQHPELYVGSIPYPKIPSSLGQLIQGISGAASRITRIVKTLKDFARPEVTEAPSELRLNDLVSGAVQFLEHHLRKSTRCFSLQLAPDLPVISAGFPGRIEQVIINVIMNASQALLTPDQAIRVSTGFDPAGLFLWVQVEDEGCGISPENLEKLTTPFFTTKRASGGSGLGLSICNSILREHGGRLEITSEEGKGTTVRILLPQKVPARS